MNRILLEVQPTKMHVSGMCVIRLGSPGFYILSASEASAINLSVKVYVFLSHTGSKEASAHGFWLW